MIDKTEEFFLKILEKIHLKKVSDMYRNHKEGMRYLVFGGLTTLVNILVYAILYYLVHINNDVSNAIAWIAGATFAYITNRKYVFFSKVKDKKGLIREIIYFYGCRLLTFGFDQAIMVITVDKFKWNALLMKIISNIIVIILNFVFSKILIFRKNNDNNKIENDKS